jgi:hypothetical protein
MAFDSISADAGPSSFPEAVGRADNSFVVPTSAEQFALIETLEPGLRSSHLHSSEK